MGTDGPSNKVYVLPSRPGQYSIAGQVLYGAQARPKVVGVADEADISDVALVPVKLAVSRAASAGMRGKRPLLQVVLPCY